MIDILQHWKPKGPANKDTFIASLRVRAKWLLFPGLNLHARLRNRVIPRYLGSPQTGETRLVLDAGCGNGMLSYQAYVRGNRVIGVSIKDEVIRNRRLFNDYLNVPDDRLAFRTVNLYDIESLGEQFDEIICSEVLEHIRDHEQVCRAFYDILKPSGVLHLCCPNSAHPDHVSHCLDHEESGGHVRAGYTYRAFKDLLEPLGFVLSAPIGLGGTVRQACNKQITKANLMGGLALATTVFVFLAPWTVLDAERPEVPYSLYVRATKPPS